MTERTASGTRPSSPASASSRPTASAPSYWAATLDGSSGLGRITRFDSERYPLRSPARSPASTPTEHCPAGSPCRPTGGRTSAWPPPTWRWHDAGIGRADHWPDTDGRGHRQLLRRQRVRPARARKLWGQGPGYVGAYQSIAWFYAASTGQISIRHGMRGPCGVLVHRTGRRAGRHRPGPPTYSAGTPPRSSPAAPRRRCARTGVVAQLSTGMLSTATDPDTRLPALRRRRLRLRTRRGRRDDARRRRGAPPAPAAPRPYGEIAGYAATFDPRPAPGQAGRSNLRRAITGKPWPRHGVTPDQVDVVFADALGVPDRDLAESRAIARSLRTLRRPRHRPQDHDRPTVRRRRRHSTWPPHYSPSATASSRPPPAYAPPPPPSNSTSSAAPPETAPYARRWYSHAATADSTPPSSSRTCSKPTSRQRRTT